MPTPIGNVEHGAVVTLSGTIRAARRQVRSPLSERECVYWAELRGLAGQDPVRSEGTDFWLEDATGKVLVRVGERVRVAVRAHRTESVIELIDADIGAVSERIRELKGIRKLARPAEARAAFAEHKHLKKVATLLCAMRAHARGNVHVGGTLDGQAAYIRERSDALEGSATTRAIKLLGAAFEVLLQDGQRIEVFGLCEEAFIPPDVGPVGGYRDTPTCIQIRAPDGEWLRIDGVGQLEPRRADDAVAVRDQTLPVSRGITAGAVVGWGVIVALGWALFRLLAG